MGHSSSLGTLSGSSGLAMGAVARERENWKMRKDRDFMIHCDPNLLFFCEPTTSRRLQCNESVSISERSIVSAHDWFLHGSNSQGSIRKVLSHNKFREVCPATKLEHGIALRSYHEFM